MRTASVGKLSDRWRAFDAVEAARLSELAKELKLHRTFGKPPDPKPVKPPKPTKPMTVERPRTMQQRMDANETFRPCIFRTCAMR
jgi:hypothetical protein